MELDDYMQLSYRLEIIKICKRETMLLIILSLGDVLQAGRYKFYLM